MKDKFWGLKKEEVDRFMRRMEREIQFELQKMEFELISTKKENERLFDLIQEKEEKQTTLSMNESILELASTRIDTVISLLSSQKESEMKALREVSSERVVKYQMEITKLEVEIKSINEIIGRFLNQIDLKPNMNDEISEPETEISATLNTLKDDINQLKPLNPPEQIVEKYEDNFVGDELDIFGKQDRPLAEPIEPVITLKERIQSYKQENQPDPLFIQEFEQETKLDLTPASKEDHILNQILSFKEQYINGKITGKDIFSQSGRLLIPVNTKITREVVDLANSEGKLAELIVNMKVTGAGEE
jgi:hypothetical protein